MRTEPLKDYERRAKVKRINALIYACHLTANRVDILALWGAETFDDMTDDALFECKDYMEAAYHGKTTPPPDTVRRLRSQALALLNRAGKYATPGDWSEVNRFLLQRKICGKLLYMLAEPELAALIRKLRSIVDKKGKAASTTGGDLVSGSGGEGAYYAVPGCVPGRLLLN